jgi:hypothetical protein
MRDAGRKRQLVLKAMRKLEKRGIIARPNYLCCTTCASSALAWDAVEAGAQGGVYWHRQDEEGLRKGKELNIGFVGAGYDDEKTAAVGRLLAEVLAEEGLDVMWDGSPDQKVGIRIRD